MQPGETCEPLNPRFGADAGSMICQTCCGAWPGPTQNGRWASILSNMSSRTTLVLRVIGVALFMTGCAHVSHLTKSQAVLAASQAGQAAGYCLADYEDPDAHFELSDKDRTWSVFYQGRVLRPGNFFLVVVDDRTTATRVVAGR